MLTLHYPYCLNEIAEILTFKEERFYIMGCVMILLITDVLGLEQFKLGHHNGGSQDYSRIMLVKSKLNVHFLYWKVLKRYFLVPPVAMSNSSNIIFFSVAMLMLTKNIQN